MDPTSYHQRRSADAPAGRGLLSRRDSMRDYDLVVIGSGPAGERGAVQAATFGKRVAVIEREPVLGGAAANTGTLPSKTLRETSLTLSGLRARGFRAVEVKHH